MKTPGYILIGENAKLATYNEYSETSFQNIPSITISSFSYIKLYKGSHIPEESFRKTLIIPTSGGINVDSNTVLVPQEYWLLENTELRIQNASDKYDSSFIRLDLKSGNTQEIRKISECKNGEKQPYFCHYNYRQEDTLKFSKPEECFIYVLSGNFEIEERYVKQGDILLLENISSVELECLSNYGTFLIFRT